MTKSDENSTIGNALFSIMKHPLWTIRLVNRRNVKTFFSLVKTDGVKGAINNVNRVVNYAEPLETGIFIPDIDLDNNYLRKKLDIPCFETPVVSIIIPVYNQIEHTFACIESIIKNTQNIPYEIILADDCSTDDTQNINQYISGLKVVRNEINLRFTLNCNNAAKYGNGKYLLFLNNDTIVWENWLNPLLELIESNPDIGMVGSKFIFPDGMLQEAGGIIWSNGSGWNYGRSRNPNSPEYNYVKEADYISGASIMISKKLWDEIGGFDERFAPSYCEDSDLAFEVRKRGFKVMYHPESIIIHYEGVSNGKTTDSGLKSYQLINQEKFKDKWKDELEKNQQKHGTNVFVARDRSFNKKTILFIDEEVPAYDENAGHRTVYQYLKILTKMGFSIKFLPNNFYYNEKYVKIYQSMGIEVLYGPYYRDNWKKWIKNNSKHIDYVMLFRPECADIYMDFIKKNTDAKIFYNVCDLHYLRLEREYECTGNLSIKKESEKMKIMETKFMKKSDCTITVSVDEKKIISTLPGKINSMVVPAYCFENTDSDLRDYENTQGLMFVGGFRHRPNEDAVVWFMEEIWPDIKKKIPECKFYIVGSNPTKKIKSYESDDVIVTGFVSDEELEEYYKKTSICVIPLRYGAGVKGKTIEAMANGIPIVSTSIGIEGSENIEEYISPKDTKEEFCEEVIRKYLNRTLAKAEAEKYGEYVNKYYSEESISNTFKVLFD